ncbi:MAG: DUF1684 domain-containing protein [Chloroflexi bacterium]|nr:DUF1684 domain-containing protein [Chloroflexota bacterium]
MTPFEQLVDYRRSVAAIYAAVRESRLDAAETWRQFCAQRDRLFKTHPQSALTAEQQARFKGLRTYEYNPALRFRLAVEPIPEPAAPEVAEIDLQADGLLRLRRVGQVRFSVGGRALALTLFWVEGYGGGLFLPFRDLTNHLETYAGGRYLLDTIKHADLGHDGDRLIIDFNYAYNPSCAYNDRWVCPLAPVENRLPVRIEAGEKQFTPQE